MAKGQLKRDLRREYKNKIKKAKRNSWREFSSELTENSDICKMIKKLKSEKIMELGSIGLNEDGNPNSLEDSLKLMLDTHQPNSIRVLTHWDDRHGDIPPIINENWEYAQRIINVDTVKKAIHSFGDFKAAGFDDISPIVLKNLPTLPLEYLTLIYQLCLSTGYIR